MISINQISALRSTRCKTFSTERNLVSTSVAESREFRESRAAGDEAGFVADRGAGRVDGAVAPVI